MMNKDTSIKIGSLELVEVGYLCQTFGITRVAAFKWLKTLQISFLTINDKAYFSPESLEVVFRVILETGKTFLLPGSARRVNNREGYGIITMSDKMIKRVRAVQTQKTNRLSERLQEWEKEKVEIQKAEQLLRKARQTIKEVNQ